MLNKKNRLTKRKEFGYIYKKGKRVNSQYINLVYTSTKLQHARFGFVVSKKIGKAYIRNKVKRRLSEIIRLDIDNISCEYNYVFVAKPGIDSLSYQQLEQEVGKLLNKLKPTIWEKNGKNIRYNIKNSSIPF